MPHRASAHRCARERPHLCPSVSRVTFLNHDNVDHADGAGRGALHRPRAHAGLTLMFVILLAFYVVALTVLSLVSLNRYILVSLRREHAHRRNETLPPLSDRDAP